MQRLLGVGILVIMICHSFALQARSDQEKSLAQKRYKVGEQLYAISQYSKALVEFTEAYRLYPVPAMLFNIARCHEVTANLKDALKYYKLYLQKVPTSPKRSLVEARIKSLEARLQQHRGAHKPAEHQSSDGWEFGD